MILTKHIFFAFRSPFKNPSIFFGLLAIFWKVKKALFFDQIWIKLKIQKLYILKQNFFGSLTIYLLKRIRPLLKLLLGKFGLCLELSILVKERIGGERDNIGDKKFQTKDKFVFFKKVPQSSIVIANFKKWKKNSQIFFLHPFFDDSFLSFRELFFINQKQVWFNDVSSEKQNKTKTNILLEHAIFLLICYLLYFWLLLRAQYLANQPKLNYRLGHLFIQSIKCFCF